MRQNSQVAVNLANYVSVKVDQDQSDRFRLMQSVIALNDVDLIVDDNNPRTRARNAREQPSIRSTSSGIGSKRSEPQEPPRRSSLAQIILAAKRKSSSIQAILANATRYLSPSPKRSVSKKGDQPLKMNLNASEAEPMIKQESMGEVPQKQTHEYSCRDEESGVVEEASTDPEVAMQAALMQFDKPVRDAILEKLQSFDPSISATEIQRDLLFYVEDLMSDYAKKQALKEEGSPDSRDSRNENRRLIQKLIDSAMQSFKSQSRRNSVSSKELPKVGRLSQSPAPKKSRFSRKVILPEPVLEESCVVKKFTDDEVNLGRGSLPALPPKLPECFRNIVDRIVCYLKLYRETWPLATRHDPEKLMSWMAGKIEDVTRITGHNYEATTTTEPIRVAPTALNGPKYKPGKPVYYFEAHHSLWSTRSVTEPASESQQPVGVTRKKLSDLFLMWAELGLSKCFSSLSQEAIQGALDQHKESSFKTYRSPFLVAIMTHIMATPSSLFCLDAGLFLHKTFLEESLMKLYSLLLYCRRYSPRLRIRVVDTFQARFG